MKADKKTANSYMPQIPRSYSINEILAAGGSTSFATKLGKKPEELEKKIASLPNDASLTAEELNSALHILNERK